MEWPKDASTLTVARALKDPFDKWVTGVFGGGTRYEKEESRRRLANDVRALARQIWAATPQVRFGGYSFAEFERFKSGAYELLGKGFMWKGQQGGRGLVVQFHPLFRNRTIDGDIRWYLERGASLGEAIGLTARQWARLNAQMIAGFALALAENVGKVSSSPGTIGAEVTETTGMATDFPFLPDNFPDLSNAFKEAVRLVASHPDEQRIQRLSRKQPTPIVKLRSRVG